MTTIVANNSCLLLVCNYFAPRHDRKDSRLSIVFIAQFVVETAGKVGVVGIGFAVLPRDHPVEALGQFFLWQHHQQCCRM